MQDSTVVGLNVHKATISVAVANGKRGGEVRHWGTVPHRPDHMRKLAEKLVSNGSRRHFCYEAGPCSYGLHRQLVELGHDCIVVAPSFIPVKTGDRVKTDRRDAVMLAKPHRAGLLTAAVCYIRALIVIGSVFYTVYYWMVPAEPLWDAMVGTTLIGAASLQGVIQIIRSRAMISAPRDTRHVLEVLGDIEPGLFRRLMRMDPRYTIEKATELTTEGVRPDKAFRL